MGCISSKVISRSISFGDDWSRRQQDFGSKNGRDQFLDLVCSSNKVQNGSTNLHSITSSHSDLRKIKGMDADRKEPMAKEIVHSMMPRLALKDVEQGQEDPPKRSKSWHQFPEDNEFAWENVAVPRSRSFHTVEEFDELLERIRLTSISDMGDGDEKSVLKERYQKTTSDEVSAKEKIVNNREADEVSPSFSVESSKKENAPLEKQMVRSSLKRRSLARGLESLIIPSTIEFPAVGSLREWLEVGGGQVSSPGTYVTPKFGSYSNSNSKVEDDCSKGYVFNPELVTAIEEDLQQLQVEEETILKQIAENWKERGDEGDQVKEEPATNIEKLEMDRLITLEGA